MSDVLIKGMEMPEGCYYCPILIGKANCSCAITGAQIRIEKVREELEDERMPDCPLAELPPHGDLKDSTLFYKKVAEQIHTIPLNKDGTVDKVSRYYIDGLVVAMNLLDSIGTILGATDE